MHSGTSLEQRARVRAQAVRIAMQGVVDLLNQLTVNSLSIKKTIVLYKCKLVCNNPLQFEGNRNG